MTWESKYIHILLENLILMPPHVPVQLLAAARALTPRRFCLKGETTCHKVADLWRNAGIFHAEDWQPGVTQPPRTFRETEIST